MTSGGMRDDERIISASLGAADDNAVPAWQVQKLRYLGRNRQVGGTLQVRYDGLSSALPIICLAAESAFFRALMFIMVALFAQPLYAQSVQMSPSEPLRIRDSTSYCKQSKITSDTLLNMINAIISHGDLTDIAYVEKTLGTKFTSKPYGVTEDGRPNSNQMLYQADQMSGAPISVELHVNFPEKTQRKFQSIGALDIGDQAIPGLNGNYITFCLGISKSEVFRYFGNDFFFRPVLGELPIGAAPDVEDGSEVSPKPGVNGSKVDVGFSDLIQANSIFSIDIDQIP